MNIATSLVTGVFISSAAAYLGTLMLGRRMALVAGPLGHLTLPGIAIALMYGFDITLGAFPFVILGIFLVWLFEVRTKLPAEALTATVFATGVATAFLLLPVEQAEAALVGDITSVGTFDLVLTAVLCMIVFLVLTRNYGKILLISISEDLARVQGINSKKHNLIYLTMVAIVVALGVKVVGGLMTAALVAIPAISSRNLSRNLLQDRLLAICFGAGSCTLGILLSQILGHPAGVLIILINAAIFVTTAVFKR
ncbi:MAG: ABC transporter [Hadesarchaea archaeon YNP_N21]|jgi:ABC-type Mn2+/Zn2+ transport system permease subunit|nr:MAG: ABC transporter [Hadesarchaea archaeon YNP_N21]